MCCVEDFKGNNSPGANIGRLPHSAKESFTNLFCQFIAGIPPTFSRNEACSAEPLITNTSDAIALSWSNLLETIKEVSSNKTAAFKSSTRRVGEFHK